MTSHIYDLIIIGSGPAGLAAAVYAQRACLDTLVIEQSTGSGGQILNTYEVDNYPLHRYLIIIPDIPVSAVMSWE